MDEGNACGEREENSIENEQQKGAMIKQQGGEQTQASSPKKGRHGPVKQNKTRFQSVPQKFNIAMTSSFLRCNSSPSYSSETQISNMLSNPEISLRIRDQSANADLTPENISEDANIIYYPSKWKAMEITSVLPDNQFMTTESAVASKDDGVCKQTVVVEKAVTTNLLDTTRQVYGDRGTSRLSEYMVTNRTNRCRMMSNDGSDVHSYIPPMCVEQRRDTKKSKGGIDTKNCGASFSSTLPNDTFNASTDDIITLVDTQQRRESIVDLNENALHKYHQLALDILFQRKRDQEKSGEKKRPNTKLDSTPLVKTVNSKSEQKEHNVSTHLSHSLSSSLGIKDKCALLQHIEKGSNIQDQTVKHRQRIYKGRANPRERRNTMSFRPQHKVVSGRCLKRRSSKYRTDEAKDDADNKERTQEEHYVADDPTTDPTILEPNLCWEEILCRDNIRNAESSTAPDITLFHQRKTLSHLNDQDISIQSILKSPSAKAAQALSHYYENVERGDISHDEVINEHDITVGEILEAYEKVLLTSLCGYCSGDSEKNDNYCLVETDNENYKIHTRKMSEPSKYQYSSCHLLRQLKDESNGPTLQQRLDNCRQVIVSPRSGLPKRQQSQNSISHKCRQKSFQQNEEVTKERTEKLPHIQCSMERLGRNKVFNTMGVRRRSSYSQIHMKRLREYYKHRVDMWHSTDQSFSPCKRVREKEILMKSPGEMHSFKQKETSPAKTKLLANNVKEKSFERKSDVKARQPDKNIRGVKTSKLSLGIRNETTTNKSPNMGRDTCRTSPRSKSQEMVTLETQVERLPAGFTVKKTPGTSLVNRQFTSNTKISPEQPEIYSTQQHLSNLVANRDMLQRTRSNRSMDRRVGTSGMKQVTNEAIYHVEHASRMDDPSKTRFSVAGAKGINRTVENNDANSKFPADNKIKDSLLVIENSKTNHKSKTIKVDSNSMYPNIYVTAVSPQFTPISLPPIVVGDSNVRSGIHSSHSCITIDVFKNERIFHLSSDIEITNVNMLPEGKSILKNPKYEVDPGLQVTSQVISASVLAEKGITNDVHDYSNIHSYQTPQSVLLNLDVSLDTSEEMSDWTELSTYLDEEENNRYDITANNEETITKQNVKHHRQERLISQPPAKDIQWNKTLQFNDQQPPSNIDVGKSNITDHVLMEKNKHDFLHEYNTEKSTTEYNDKHTVKELDNTSLMCVKTHLAKEPKRFIKRSFSVKFSSPPTTGTISVKLSSPPNIETVDVKPSSLTNMETIDLKISSSPNMEAVDVKHPVVSNMETLDVKPSSPSYVGIVDFTPSSPTYMETVDVKPSSSPNMETIYVKPSSPTNMETIYVKPSSHASMETIYVKPSSPTNMGTVDVTPSHPPNIETVDMKTSSPPNMGTIYVNPPCRPNLETVDVKPPSLPNTKTVDVKPPSPPNVGTVDVNHSSYRNIETVDVRPSSPPNTSAIDVESSSAPKMGTVDVKLSNLPYIMVNIDMKSSSSSDTSDQREINELAVHNVTPIVSRDFITDNALKSPGKTVEGNSDPDHAEYMYKNAPLIHAAKSDMNVKSKKDDYNEGQCRSGTNISEGKVDTVVEKCQVDSVERDIGFKDGSASVVKSDNTACITDLAHSNLEGINMAFPNYEDVIEGFHPRDSLGTQRETHQNAIDYGKDIVKPNGIPQTLSMVKADGGKVGDVLKPGHTEISFCGEYDEYIDLNIFLPPSRFKNCDDTLPTMKDSGNDTRVKLLSTDNGNPEVLDGNSCTQSLPTNNLVVSPVGEQKPIKPKVMTGSIMGSTHDTSQEIEVNEVSMKLFDGNVEMNHVVSGEIHGGCCEKSSCQNVSSPNQIEDIQENDPVDVTDVYKIGFQNSRDNSHRMCSSPIVGCQNEDELSCGKITREANMESNENKDDDLHPSLCLLSIIPTFSFIPLQGNSVDSLPSQFPMINHENAFPISSHQFDSYSSILVETIEKESLQNEEATISSGDMRGLNKCREKDEEELKRQTFENCSTDQKHSPAEVNSQDNINNEDLCVALTSSFSTDLSSSPTSRYVSTSTDMSLCYNKKDLKQLVKTIANETAHQFLDVFTSRFISKMVGTLNKYLRDNHVTNNNPSYCQYNADRETDSDSSNDQMTLHDVHKINTDGFVGTHGDTITPKDQRKRPNVFNTIENQNIWLGLYDSTAIERENLLRNRECTSREYREHGVVTAPDATFIKRHFNGNTFESQSPEFLATSPRKILFFRVESPPPNKKTQRNQFTARVIQLPRGKSHVWHSSWSDSYNDSDLLTPAQRRKLLSVRSLSINDTIYQTPKRHDPFSSTSQEKICTSKKSPAQSPLGYLNPECRFAAYGHVIARRYKKCETYKKQGVGTENLTVPRHNVCLGVSCLKDKTSRHLLVESETTTGDTYHKTWSVVSETDSSNKMSRRRYYYEVDNFVELGSSLSDIRSSPFTCSCENILHRQKDKDDSSECDISLPETVTLLSNDEIRDEDKHQNVRYIIAIYLLKSIIDLLYPPTRSMSRAQELNRVSQEVQTSLSQKERIKTMDSGNDQVFDTKNHKQDPTTSMILEDEDIERLQRCNKNSKPLSSLQTCGRSIDRIRTRSAIVYSNNRTLGRCISDAFERNKDVPPFNVFNEHKHVCAADVDQAEDLYVKDTTPVDKSSLLCHPEGNNTTFTSPETFAITSGQLERACMGFLQLQNGNDERFIDHGRILNPQCSFADTPFISKDSFMFQTGSKSKMLYKMNRDKCHETSPKCKKSTHPDVLTHPKIHKMWNSTLTTHETMHHNAKHEQACAQTSQQYISLNLKCHSNNHTHCYPGLRQEFPTHSLSPNRAHCYSALREKPHTYPKEVKQDTKGNCIPALACPFTGKNSFMCDLGKTEYNVVEQSNSRNHKKREHYKIKDIATDENPKYEYIKFEVEAGKSPRRECRLNVLNDFDYEGSDHNDIVFTSFSEFSNRLESSPNHLFMEPDSCSSDERCESTDSSCFGLKDVLADCHNIVRKREESDAYRINKLREVLGDMHDKFDNTDTRDKKYLKMSLLPQDDNDFGRRNTFPACLHEIKTPVVGLDMGCVVQNTPDAQAKPEVHLNKPIRLENSTNSMQVTCDDKMGSRKKFDNSCLISHWCQMTGGSFRFQSGNEDNKQYLKVTQSDSCLLTNKIFERCYEIPHQKFAAETEISNGCKYETNDTSSGAQRHDKKIQKHNLPLVQDLPSNNTAASKQGHSEEHVARCLSQINGESETAIGVSKSPATILKTESKDVIQNGSNLAIDKTSQNTQMMDQGGASHILSGMQGEAVNGFPQQGKKSEICQVLSGSEDVGKIYVFQWFELKQGAEMPPRDVNGDGANRTPNDVFKSNNRKAHHDKCSPQFPGVTPEEEKRLVKEEGSTASENKWGNENDPQHDTIFPVGNSMMFKAKNTLSNKNVHREAFLGEQNPSTDNAEYEGLPFEIVDEKIKETVGEFTAKEIINNSPVLVTSSGQEKSNISHINTSELLEPTLVTLDLTEKIIERNTEKDNGNPVTYQRQYPRPCPRRKSQLTHKPPITCLTSKFIGHQKSQESHIENQYHGDHFCCHKPDDNPTSVSHNRACSILVLERACGNSIPIAHKTHSHELPSDEESKNDSTRDTPSKEKTQGKISRVELIKQCPLDKQLMGRSFASCLHEKPDKFIKPMLYDKQHQFLDLSQTLNTVASMPSKDARLGLPTKNTRFENTQRVNIMSTNNKAVQSTQSEHVPAKETSIQSTQTEYVLTKDTSVQSTHDEHMSTNDTPAQSTQREHNMSTKGASVQSTERDHLSTMGISSLSTQRHQMSIKDTSVQKIQRYDMPTKGTSVQSTERDHTSTKGASVQSTHREYNSIMDTSVRNTQRGMSTKDTSPQSAQNEQMPTKDTSERMPTADTESAYKDTQRIRNRCHLDNRRGIPPRYILLKEMENKIETCNKRHEYWSHRQYKHHKNRQEYITGVLSHDNKLPSASTRQLYASSSLQETYLQPESSKRFVSYTTRHMYPASEKVTVRNYKANPRSRQIIDFEESKKSYGSDTAVSKIRATTQFPVELKPGEPRQIVKDFKKSRATPSEIPIDLYELHPWRQNSRKITSKNTGEVQTLSISGPLMNVTVPVHRHDDKQNMMQSYKSSGAIGFEGDLLCEEIEDSSSFGKEKNTTGNTQTRIMTREPFLLLRNDKENPKSVWRRVMNKIVLFGKKKT